jgi:cytosine deaminase
MVGQRAADTLCLGDRYGIEPGRPASFVVLPAADGFDAIRRQVRPSVVVSRGRVVATTEPAATELTWPGSAPEQVDFVRAADSPLTPVHHTTVQPPAHAGG